MLAVIAMALSIHDALHGGAARFALTFVAVRGIVLLLNARARRHAAAARPLLNLYLTAFSIGASLWLLSVFVPEPALRPVGGRAADRAVRALGGPPPDRQGADPRQPPGRALRAVHPHRARRVGDLGRPGRRRRPPPWPPPSVASSPWPACGGAVSTASTRAPSAACSGGSSVHYLPLLAAPGLGRGRHRVRGPRGGQRDPGAVDHPGPGRRDGAVPALHRGGRPGRPLRRRPGPVAGSARRRSRWPWGCCGRSGCRSGCSWPSTSCW